MRSLDVRAFPGRSVRALGDPYRVVVTATEPSPFVDLVAVRAAPGGYLSLLGPQTRAAIRRSRREYVARGELVLHAADNAQTACAYLTELAELSRRRFDHARDRSSFESPYFLKFHLSLVARCFEHGEIQLLRLSAGGQTVGLLYNFVANGIVSFYQSGFEYDENPKLRPGLLAHAEAIEWSSAAGHRIYDFLGGHARYKQALSTSAEQLISVRVQKPLIKFRVEERLRSLRNWVRETRDRSRAATTGSLHSRHSVAD